MVMLCICLALTCSLTYCITNYLRARYEIPVEVVRTIDANSNKIDYQSILDEFENGKLETVGTKTTFEGTKSISLDDLTIFDNLAESFDNLAESDVDICENIFVTYKFSYDKDTNIATMSAITTNDGCVIEIEEISGTVFTNEFGNIDAVFEVDGSYILLSEMQDIDIIQNCGWFKNIFKKIVVATVAVVAVAAVTTVVVATCGAGLGACIAAGAIAGAVAGGVAGGIISYSEYGKLDWKWIVGGAVIGAALGAVTGWGVGTMMGAGATQTTQVKGLIDAANKGELKFSNTVNNYYVSGQRPYCNSTTLVKEIMQAKAPIADSQTATGLKWIVEGNFNGIDGYWDLVVDPVTKTIWHLVFAS